MVAQFWLDMATGLASYYGLTPVAMLLVLVFLISAGAAAGLAYSFKNKDLGVFTFFCMLGLFTFVGAVDWFVIVIPLVLVGAIYIFTGGK